MQRPQEYTAIFEDKQIYNDKFTHLHFELKEPHTIDFKAGQFVSVKVDEKTHRAYSICSDPDIKHGIEIFLDVTPQGKGVTYLTNLEFGDEMQFLGPMGRFVIQDQKDKTDHPEKALVLVGTGCGVAPLRSIVIDQLKNKQDERPITLYWGLRYASHLVWQDEFSRLSKQYSNFSFHPTLSRAEKQWPLCRGRVTNCLNVHELPENAGYYLCGSKAMVDDVRQVLLNKGVDKGSIHHEKFS